MAQPQSNAAVTLSLLDRLTDDQPDQSQEPPMGRLQSLRKLKRSVCEDLGRLLNTKRGEDDIPPEFEQANMSVLGYGLTDFTSLGLRNPAAQNRLRRAIENAIRAFEPRLTGVTVTLESPGELEPILRFRVEALLDIRPAPEPIRFDTVLRGDTGQFLVEAEKT